MRVSPRDFKNFIHGAMHHWSMCIVAAPGCNMPQSRVEPSGDAAERKLGLSARPIEQAGHQPRQTNRR